MVFMIILIIVVGILILLLMPIYINIKVQRENNNDNIELKVFLLKGLIKFGIEIPFIDIILAGNKPSVEVKEKIEEGENEKDVSENKHIITLKEILKFIEKGLHVKTTILIITRYLIRKIQIIKVVWRTSIGFENAAITGVLSGGLWSVKGFILSVILNNKEIEDLKLKVIPHFNKNIFETYIDCIIKLRLVYIIIAGLKGLKAKLKGGEVDE